MTLVSCRPVIWIVHHTGLKCAILIGAAGLCVGGWIRYVGAVVIKGGYPVTFFAQLLIGMAGPITLIVPTHYSELWFSPKGRVSAIALMTLANPAGIAVSVAIITSLATRGRNTNDLELTLQNLDR